MAKSRVTKNIKIEKNATTSLLKYNPSYRKLKNAGEKRNLAHAFFLEKDIQLTIGKVSSLKAFDLVRCKKSIDFSKVEDIRKKIEDITLIEVKATYSKKYDETFSNLWFNLSVREFWLAVALKEQYRFILVHEGLGKYQELRWQDILARAKTVNLDFKITLE